MDSIRHIDADFIEQNTHFPALIDALRAGFASKDILVPLRHHHDFPNPHVERESSMLLMPAWQPNNSAGVKVVVVSPENGKQDLPAIQGVYMLFDVKSGSPKALVDAKKLTTKRTASASVLAATYLARPTSRSLLVVGTGALAPELIQAYSSVFPLERILIWGRNLDKAQAVIDSLKDFPIDLAIAEDLEAAAKAADIISCATLSKTPLIKGKWLNEGQHLDLIGAYRPDMREADDDAILRGSVFVDTMEGGQKESGDIVIPLQNGTLKKEDIKAELFGLCSETALGRTAEEEITIFKSVGHALEDLVAANYYYDLTEQ